eukprot:1334147-Prymnesium_polylepis.1
MVVSHTSLVRVVRKLLAGRWQDAGRTAGRTWRARPRLRPRGAMLQAPSMGRRPSAPAPVTASQTAVSRGKNLSCCLATVNCLETCMCLIRLQTCVRSCMLRVSQKATREAFARAREKLHGLCTSPGKAAWTHSAQK